MIDTSGNPNPGHTDSEGSISSGKGRVQTLQATTEQLRSMILSGELKPDQPVSQLAIGRKLGVSATPVREAIRMLTADGLLVSAHNQRARVAPLNVQDLEAIYSARVAGEAVAIAMTVQTIAAEELKRLDQSLQSLHSAAEQGVLEVWVEAHAMFHKLLVSGANPFQLELLASLFDRSERYRRLSVLESNPRTWAAANAEHEEIVAACRRRDAAGAAGLLANHLGRTALMLTASFAPDVDAATVRTAVSIVGSWAGAVRSGHPTRYQREFGLPREGKTL